ncbi:hypothetical protein LH612_28035, partial [Klebsiella pneumoniae]|nr:hypothetical protein [Klebsiella pneumoniae]
PEFINRIDDAVVFQPLQPQHLQRITRLLLENTARQLQDKGIELDVSDEAVYWLVEHGYQPEFGARPLRRTIQREVDDPISDMLLSGELHSGQELQVSAADGELSFSMRPAGGDQAS